MTRILATGLVATSVLFSALTLAGPVPALAPLPAAPKVDPRMAELGRHLFFDNRLSGDWSRSCSSCHMPSRGWADGEALSRGYLGTQYFRNAPGLVDAVYRKRFMWDGRLDDADLPAVVRDMVTAAHFMNADARIVQERLKQVPEYLRRWKEIFGADADPYGPRMFAVVGEFLKTLVSAETPLDRYLRGERNALSRSESKGYALFNGKAGCVNCHNGPLASDHQFHRLGVPEHPDVLGNPLRSITMLRHYASFGVPDYMAARADLGLYAVTKDESDRGKFLTPGLRELKQTAPYMHNGVFRRLEDVVEFYDRGGGKDSELKVLGLTVDEKHALIAFLLCMSAEPVRVPVPVPLDFQVRKLGDN